MSSKRTARAAIVAVMAAACLTVGSTSIAMAAPDLTAIKTNDVNGLVRNTDTWHWTVHVENVGTEPAVFADGQTMLLDQPPENPYIQYGPLTVANLSGISGPLVCAYISSGPAPRGFVCLADRGPVSVAAGGSFDVTLQANPNRVDEVYKNPDPAGRCSVDPSGHLVESNEGNNDCSDTVTVATEDLTADKTNDVHSSIALGSSFTWTIAIANRGHRTATVPDSRRLLVDSLPDQNISYGAVTASSAGGAIGPVACAIDTGVTLTCSASGGSLSLPPGSSILVSVTATPSASGNFANPRSGGVCAANPDFAVPGGADPCADSVTVGVPDLTVTKTNSTNGKMLLGGRWFWQIMVSNDGGGKATFQSGQVVLVDDLPAGDIAYGPLQGTFVGDPNLACSIGTDAQLRCVASGGPVSLGPGGWFEVIFPATPSAGKVFANPRSGGMCSVDPDGAVGETDDTNNTCEDTVTVLAPTSTELTCVPSSVDVGTASDCKATVTDTSASPSTPTGSVFFDSGGGGTFSSTTCSLVATAPDRASCSASFTPTLAGDRLVRAIYLGDEIHRQSASPVTHITAIAVDSKPPTARCDSPDGAWHATDVSIACTASDDESGLADPAEASFSLSTDLPAGTEDANTATDSREVCDNAGNCATAGPIAGNKVDKRNPSISIVRPGATETYLLNESVSTSYSCADGGSGIASCSGPVADGSAIDTSSVGWKSFAVAAADNAGNTASQTHDYRVAYDFGGFYNPVYNPPSFNTRNAGGAIAVKFSLGGYSGLGVLASGSPHSSRIDCVSSADLGDIKPTVSTASGLVYDPVSGQYQYTWKAEKQWAGTCRQLDVELADGTDHRAKFRFR